MLRTVGCLANTEAITEVTLLVIDRIVFYKRVYILLLHFFSDFLKIGVLYILTIHFVKCRFHCISLHFTDIRWLLQSTSARKDKPITPHSRSLAPLQINRVQEVS